MDYGNVYAWAKCIDLVRNRSSVANDVLEVMGYGRPLTLDYRRGSYRLTWDGHRIADAEVYDLEKSRALLAFVEGVRRAVWMLSREGLIAP